MARYRFNATGLVAFATYRIDTASGSTSAATIESLQTAGSGISSTLRTDANDELPGFAGAVATLYAKQLTPSGVVTGSPTTLTGTLLDSTAGSNTPEANTGTFVRPAQLGTTARDGLPLGAVGRSGGLSPIVTLMAGTDDETLVLTNCTAAADTVNYRVGTQGWKLTASGAGTMVAAVGPVPPVTSGALTVTGAQSLCAWIYIPDITLVNEITIYIYMDSGLTNTYRWGKDNTVFPVQALVNGWNLFRIPADFAPNQTFWGQIYRVAVLGVATATGATMTIGHVYMETPQKARLLIVQDGGYTSFWTSQYGYADLKSRGIPVTLAADMALLGTGSGYFTRMSLAQMQAFANENGNSISMHSWDGTVTSGMTAAQIRADTARCVKFLAANGGYAGRMWRAAYVQGNAPQASASRGLVVGAATGNTALGGRYSMWPPGNIMDIPRVACDNTTSTNSTIDARFTFLQSTHMTDVVFFHGIDDAQAFGTSVALWQHFLAQVDAAMAAGWLECVTFEQLFYESGGTFQDINGAHVATYTDASGQFVSHPVL